MNDRNAQLPAELRNSREVLDQFRRNSWIPVVIDGEGDVASSRFGGRPSILPGESWPTCGTCHEKMPLFVQIDLAIAPRTESTPVSLHTGLLQLFYCTNELCDNADCGPFPTNAIARIVQSANVGTPPIGTNGPTFPAKRISDWSVAPDFPNAEEAIALGIPLSVNQIDQLYAWESDHENPMPIQRDKIYGWPDWVQSMFYPLCPVCRQRMFYLFQMSSNDHITFMFGDAGIGHICVCPLHLDRASFYWNCC